MKRLALTTAVVLGLAAPAAASNQLALSLGVEPGAFSASELIDLRKAKEEQDRARIDFILSGGATSDTVEESAAAVEAAARRAEEEGDYRQAAFLRDRAENGAVSVSSRSAADALTGPADTIDTVVMDTSDLSAGEIVNLSRALEEGDRVRAFGILSRIGQ
jgi:hypothetical protein